MKPTTADNTYTGKAIASVPAMALKICANFRFRSVTPRKVAANHVGETP